MPLVVLPYLVRHRVSSLSASRAALPQPLFRTHTARHIGYHLPNRRDTARRQPTKNTTKSMSKYSKRAKK